MRPQLTRDRHSETRRSTEKFGRCRTFARSTLSSSPPRPRPPGYYQAMSKEHWHLGSRSDYIASLALARTHADNQSRFNSHPKHDTHNMPERLHPSAIPDLRFEPTYLAKLAAAGPGWQSVVWITVRDQVISPLFQGAVWCVVCPTRSTLLDETVYRGAASMFIQPLLRSFTGWWSESHAPRHPKEGSAAGWLRQWARSLFPDTRLGNSLGIR